MNRPAEKTLALVGVPRALPHQRAHRRRRAVLARAPGAARRASRASTRCRPSTWWRSSASRPSTGASSARYRVLDALTTLAFDYPPRAGLLPQASSSSSCCSRSEDKLDPLTAHRLLRRRHGRPAVHALELPPLRGGCEQRQPSRPVGATGPTSFASVANYLHQHGWQYGAPVLAEATLRAGPYPDVDPRNLDAQRDLGSLRRARHQARPHDAGRHARRC